MNQTIDLAEIPLSVRHRRISGKYGWRILLDPPHGPTDLDDGASVTLQVTVRAQEEPLSPPGLDFLWDDPAEEDRSRSPRRDGPEADDTTLMARRPVLQPPSPEDLPPSHDNGESATSATMSTYDSDRPSHHFHIFQIQAPMHEARIHASTWELMYSNIRSVLSLRRHQLQQLHIVTHLPGDLRASGTHVALVHKQGDLREGDDRRLLSWLTLFFMSMRLVTPTPHRSLQLLRSPITRQQFFDIAERRSIRRHYGPIRPTSVQRRRIQLGQQISGLRAEGFDDYVWWFPSQDPPLVERVYYA